jgi:hypothetical protein
MKKWFPILAVLFWSTSSLAQQRLRFGLSIGSTLSALRATEKNEYGHVTPGPGINFYVPVSCRLSENLGIETGFGYFFNRYGITYDNAALKSVSGSPFFPLKLIFTKQLTEQKHCFASAGVALQTAFAKGVFINSIIDTFANVIINQKTVLKPFALLHAGLGYRKKTEQNNLHEISLQLFYGLQKQVDGSAFHTASPDDSFTFIGKGHFVSLQYTFWFGKKE